MQSSAAPPPPPPPPHLALCYAVLCCAVLCCAGGVLVLVLCCGVLVLCCCFNTEQAGDTPLLAAVGNCGTRLVKVLLDAQANIEAAHKVGRLHRCCCCCCTWAHMSCAVDVWAWQNGLTPLLLAARYGLRKHITLLLEHGASVRAVDAVSCVASCCDARSVAFITAAGNRVWHRTWTMCLRCARRTGRCRPSRRWLLQAQTSRM